MTINEELLNNRSVAYDAVFLGELPYNPQPEEQDIGLSGLWRAFTIKGGSNGDKLNTHLDNVAKQVETIIQDHDNAARQDPSDTDAIFSFIDYESKNIVINITGSIVSIWEKALYRNGYDSLVDSLRPSDRSLVNPGQRSAHLLAQKSIVLETAAAVMKVLPVYARQPLRSTKREQQEVAQILANWGPQFLVEWMDGTVLEHWLNSQGVLPQERAEWQAMFTPHVRKRLAVGNIADPLSALDRVKSNLDLLSDNTLLASRLGWSEEEVASTLSVGVRKHLAVNNITDPLAGAIIYAKLQVR